MKILSQIFVIATLLTGTGCNDWLDVTPQAQVNADKLFSTPEGFENAMYGVYTSMAQATTYGKNMTWGFMDVLPQYYKVYSNSNHTYYEASRYNYNAGNSKDAIREIWLNTYKSIANCNILLESLEEKGENFFSGDNYRLMKAEALAIRAFLHFDMLRAFTPSWDDNKDGMGIPYAESFSKKIHPQLPVREILKRILADLETARELLKDIDPVFAKTFKDMYYHYYQPLNNISNLGDFRAYHMNYFAVTGLIARVYHYMGDKNAYTYAKEIIDALHDGYFEFTQESELSGSMKYKNVTMENEVLFALNFPGVQNLFYSSEVVGTTRFELNDVNSLFPFPDDLRKNLVGENSSSGKMVSYKFADIKSDYGGKVPLIRVAEMFLIAAESRYGDDKTEALGYLKELQTMRGVTMDLSNISYDQLITMLTGEARREFIGEGQMFYWYKRLGLPVDRGAGSITLTKQNFSLPMPSAEIEFGGRVEEYLH